MMRRIRALRIAAVIVGVNNGLRLAENDALDIWSLLSSGAGPFRHDGAVLLRGADATVAAVDAALRELAREKPDVIIVFFAGHADERAILLAGGVPYAYATLFRRLEEAGASRQLVILDACRSGAFAKMVAQVEVGGPGLGRFEYESDAQWLKSYLQSAHGRRVITSARSTESAHESISPYARNSFFTASFLERARTLPADLPGGFVSDVPLVEGVTHDLAVQGLQQTPVWWGSRSPIAIVRSEHDAAVGRAAIASVRALGPDLFTQISTTGRRYLPTTVHASAYSHLTGAAESYHHTFMPLGNDAFEPVRIHAGGIMLDYWHQDFAWDGYTIEWTITVRDVWGRTLATWVRMIDYRAA